MSERLLSYREILDQGGRVVYTNKGISMLPLLRPGRDVMVIESTKFRHCRKYDAVLFVRKNGQYVLHRILKEKDCLFWIVGDNCMSGEWVTSDQIIGVLTSISRGGRKISVKNPIYILYVYLWCAPWPLRFFIMKCWNFGKVIVRKALR